MIYGFDVSPEPEKIGRIAVGITRLSKGGYVDCNGWTSYGLT